MAYRYRLWRCWDESLPRVCFCLLNPSTADEVDNDPTIERQQRRVMQWNTASMFVDSVKRFGAIEIVNAFAYRSTNPGALYKIDDPVGDGNGDAITEAGRAAIQSGGLFVCGWGSHVDKVDPYAQNCLLDMLENESIPLSALKLNADGSPQHPLYLSYSLRPRRWIGGELTEVLV